MSLLGDAADLCMIGSYSSNHTIWDANVTQITNETLQPATDWQDLSRRLNLLQNSSYWSSQHIPASSLSRTGLPCNASGIIQLVPHVCDIIYGNETPDVTGLGVFVGDTTEIWLSAVVIALLPVLKKLYLDEASESRVQKVLLQGYYTVLTMTVATNLIFAAWTSAASIHELKRRPTLSTHWYLHDFNIDVFCMISLTSLYGAFLLYTWEEYVSSMIVNGILYIVVLGLFAGMMVIDHRMPEDRMRSVAAACVSEHREMVIPGMNLSFASTKLWHSYTVVYNMWIWIIVGAFALFFLFIMLAAIHRLMTIPLKCINNVSIKEHLTRLVRCVLPLSTSTPVKASTPKTAHGQSSDLENQAGHLKKVQKKIKLLWKLLISTFVFLLGATISTILLYNTRKQIMQVTESHGDPWLFGQYGAVILWIPIVLEAIRIAIAATIALAFCVQDPESIRDTEELYEMGPGIPHVSHPAHTASRESNAQVSSRSFDSAERASRIGT